MLKKTLRFVAGFSLAILLSLTSMPQAQAGIVIGVLTAKGTAVFTFVPDRQLERAVRNQIMIPGFIISGVVGGAGIYLIAKSHTIFGISLVLLDSQDNASCDEITQKLSELYPEIDDREVLGNLAQMIQTAAKNAIALGATVEAPMEVRFEPTQIIEALAGTAIPDDVYQRIMTDFTK